MTALDAWMRRPLGSPDQAVIRQTAAASLTDDPLRYQLANELHARPFPVASAPGWVAFLALRTLGGDASPVGGAERAHLLSLLDRFGASHPPPEATSWYGSLGRCQIKWERHTEFVTDTALGEGSCSRLTVTRG